jgi:hypothetical protein
MAKEVKIGQQDYSVLVFIPDPASTDGSGKTGLVAANLTVSGVRVETDNDVTVTDYTASLNDLSALTDAHTDWGLKEVSSTLAPGLYRLDIADALFLTGAWSAVLYVMITSGAAAASPIEFILVPDAPYTGVNVSQWLGAACHAATVNGVPVVQMHDSAGAGGINAPANFEDLAIVDTTGLVDITQTAADKVWGTAARVLTANTNLAGVEVDVTKIHGTAISETGAGYIAGSFTKFFDKQTPTGTINSLPDAVPGANGGLPTTNGTKVSQTVDLTASQEIAADLTKIHGTALTETEGQLAAAFIKMYDVATPVLTCESVNQAGDAHVHADAVDILTKASGGGDLAAIKTKTDKMTYTSGNDLDVNVQKVNDVALTGDGSATPWGPA